jgi:hypothetical protein
MNLKSIARKATSAYRRSQSANTRTAPSATARGPARRHTSPKAQAVQKVSRFLRSR